VEWGGQGVQAWEPVVGLNVPGAQIEQGADPVQPRGQEPHTWELSQHHEHTAAPHDPLQGGVVRKWEVRDCWPLMSHTAPLTPFLV